MDVKEWQAGDIEWLWQKARVEKDAKQRDRLRAVAMALEGMETKAIMEKLDRSKNFVQRWTYFYRDGGLEAIAPTPQPGRPGKLACEDEPAFKKRILTGPGKEDLVCRLSGPEARKILEREFGVRYSLPGVYALMHRLGLACLKPRPQHRKNGPEAMEQWLEEAPFLSSKSETSGRRKQSKSGSRTK